MTDHSGQDFQEDINTSSTEESWAAGEAEGGCGMQAEEAGILDT